MTNVNFPPVSVVIPCYNHSEYVTGCLESVIKGYSGEIEIVICDDFSNDDSYEKIQNFVISAEQKWPDMDITTLKNKENKGVSYTLNRCIAKTKHDIIYTIASDDSLLPYGLDSAVAKMMTSDSDAVISDCVVIDDNGLTIFNSAFFDFRKANKPQLNSNNLENLREELVFNWVVPGPSLLIKKRVYDFIGLYNESIRAEDRDFYLRLLADGVVRFNEVCIANYRVHMNNFSKRQDYLSNAYIEFSRVNYSHAKRYKGLANLYLSIYYIDIKLKAHNLTRALRKAIKFLYQVKVLVNKNG